MSTAEGELLRELDAHDALLRRCARGELSWSEFEAAYDSFYERYPLDGHESGADELSLFDKHAARIALHREVWERVLTKVTGDEYLHLRATVDAGFIGSQEAIRRVQELAREHLLEPRRK